METFVGFDTLKRSVSMARVLDRYGLTDRLRRVGDNLSGACPLHHGHNSTQFRVSLTKDCWICFGDCQTGGSIIDFVSRKEGIGIRDAALLIQSWFNVRGNKHGGPVGHNVSNATIKKRAKNDSNPPVDMPPGRLYPEHSYLKERGLTKETIETFDIGHCSQGSLSGWIAIPIHNHDGTLVGFAGRWPGKPPDGIPKYRLPRGFRKSLELFNQHRVKALRSPEPLVIVEGFFGCMRVWQSGHRRVVSTMGSMLSRAQEDQIARLAGGAGHVVLMFDGDAAGRKGQEEAHQRLHQCLEVAMIHLPDNGQPDSVNDDVLLSLIRQSRRKEMVA